MKIETSKTEEVDHIFSINDSVLIGVRHLIIGRGGTFNEAKSAARIELIELLNQVLISKEN